MALSTQVFFYECGENLKEQWRTVIEKNLFWLLSDSGGELVEIPDLESSHVQATGTAQDQENDQDALRVGPDGRSVYLRGEEFTLTPTQAVVFEILHQAWLNRTPDVSKTYIMERLGLDPKKTELSHIFKRQPNWKKLI